MKFIVEKALLLPLLAALTCSSSLLFIVTPAISAQECSAPELPPQARALDIATGNWKAQALKSFITSGIAEAMEELCADGKMYAEVKKIAKKARTNPDATYRLLRFLATFDVVVEGVDDNKGSKRSSNFTFALGPIGEVVMPNNPQTVAAAVVLEASFPHVTAWNFVTDFVKTNKKITKQAFNKDNAWDMIASDPDHKKVFYHAMSGYSNEQVFFLTTPDLSPTFDLSRHKTICDLGCAEGRLALGLARRFPNADYILADLPNVIENIDQSKLPPNYSTAAVDFFKSVPAACAYVLKAIIHDWDDKATCSILKNIQKANSAATVYVIEFGPMPEPNVPHLAKGFDLHMGLMVEGAERTQEEYDVLWKNCGFQRVATHLLADGTYPIYIQEIKVAAETKEKKL